MSKLVVYKASAGSGKTWRLAVEYIKLLLQRPDAYRHILAVTFTNKAAGEMKERVLDNLWALSQGREDNKTEHLMQALAQEMGPSWTADKIRQQASLALTLILHDYSYFRIETIDTFFQTVLRNLARELGLGSSFNIDLDNDAVLEKAVADLFEKASEHPELLKWIGDYIDNQIDQGRSRYVGKALMEFGQNIFKEKFQQYEGQLAAALHDKDFLKNYQEQLQALKKKAVKEIDQAVGQFFKIYDENDWCEENFAHGKSGVLGYFFKLKDGKYDPGIVGARVLSALEDAENWVTKNGPLRDEIIDMAEEELIPILEHCEDVRARNWPVIASVELSLAHLYQAGLLSDIAATTNQLNEEENRFLLSNTAHLLQAVVSDSDASFIFEKIGADLDHIMIDEFQDTSQLQWANFRQLLTECLANGHDNLIVGDEKQSIYRFRNGDWRILGHIADQLATARTDIRDLSRNFRSARSVVEFNNRLFPALIEKVCLQYQESIGAERCDEIRHAYANVQQECVRKNTEGLARIEFFKDDKDNDSDYRTWTLDRLVALVEELQRKGIRPEQITILVRKNKAIPVIAQHFARYKQSVARQPDKLGLCYEIVSDEAFQLRSSPSIRMMVAALRYISRPDNAIALQELKSHFETDCPEDLPTQLAALSQLPLTEIIDRLYQLLRLAERPGQESYLFSFLDHVNDFVAQNASDIGEFLTYWDDILSKNPIPMGARLQGIRILSIHKSKGLQYHTVIVPFCDWSLQNETPYGNTVWSHTDVEPFAALPLVPVDFGDKMAQSVYRADWCEESQQLLIDSLNMLYVALTRSENNLFILSKQDKGKVNHISDLLSLQLNQWPEFDAEQAVYAVGALSTGSDKSAQQQGDIAVGYQSFPLKTRFRQSNRSRDFIRDKEGPFTTDYIEHGKLMHYIFSQIRHRQDAARAVHQAVSEGLLAQDLEQETLQAVEKALAHPEAAQWYRGDEQLFNECAILYRDSEGHLQERRPDRVICRGREVQVIDFKFGQPQAKYRRQVQEYMHLLSEMGFSPVQGWLWYVETGIVQQVKAD
ncbi:MAG: UvrD-helicase domain-containing protein [Bacteroidales bacterium]|nr:UvrD-helicase domain-containing protein [Bacteroidales bacterium]